MLIACVTCLSSDLFTVNYPMLENQCITATARGCRDDKQRIAFYHRADHKDSLRVVVSGTQPFIPD